MAEDDVRLLYDDDEEYDISANFPTWILWDLSVSQIDRSLQSESERKWEKQRVREKPTLLHPSSSDHHLSQTVPTPTSLPIESPTSLTATRPTTPETPTNLIIEPTMPQNKRVASNGSMKSYTIPSADGTPKRLEKREQEVQTLQGIFVNSLINFV